MKILKPKIIFRIAVLGLCLAFIGFAVAPKPNKQERSGQVAGTDTNPLLVDNKFCDDPSSSDQIGCIGFVSNVLANTPYQDVSGPVTISGKTTMTSDIGDYTAKIQNTRSDETGNGLWIDTHWNVTNNIPFRVTSNTGTSELFRINGNGYVGIKTANPATALEVNGVITGTATAPNYLIKRGGANTGIYIEGDGSISSFVTGNRGWTQYGGSIGIGTATPAQKLQVQGNGYFDNSCGGVGCTNGVRAIYSGSTSVLGEFATLAHRNGVWSTVYASSGSTPGYAAYFIGNGYLSASSWSYGSDRRLKENIQYMNNLDALNIISALKPATFDYIDGSKNDAGFIAQDVQKVLPNLVTVTNSETGILGLKIENLIPYLVKGIQQLQNTIQQLINNDQNQQQQIEQLKNEVNSLKQEIQALKAK